MMELINKKEYALGYMRENIEMMIYTGISFLVPFMIGHPQLLVGIIVNFSLVMAALNLKGYRMLPVILAPSLGTLARGMVFGPMTIYLAYMIPFIWIGNSLLVLGMKKLVMDIKLSKLLSLVISSAVKAAFLFLAAYVLVGIEVIPSIFLTTMGIFQLYTAIAGGIAALGADKLKLSLKI